MLLLIELSRYSVWHAYCNSNRCKYDWLIYTAKPKNEKVLE